MTRGLINQAGLVLIIVAIAFVSNAGGKTRSERRLPKDARATAVVMIEWECTTRARVPKARLGKLVRYVLRDKGEGTIVDGDRAFPYDLNNDKRPEYLVPLECNSFGDCLWGIFAVNPPRFLGRFLGGALYPRKPVENWATISTCTHVSGSECMLVTYCFRQDRYKQCSREYLISAYQHNEPKFMERLNPTCDPHWHLPARSKR